VEGLWILDSGRREERGEKKWRGMRGKGRGGGKEEAKKCKVKGVRK